MLMPYEYVIFDLNELRQMQKFIENATGTKAFPVNYDKMQKAGILDLYQKVQDALYSQQRQQNLNNIDLSKLEDLC